MSVNLHLSITVRGYSPERVDAIKQSVREAVVTEQLDNDLPPLKEGEDKDGKYLSSRTDLGSPVIISRAYLWCPEFQNKLQAAAVRANGLPCSVVFDWADADEEDESDYEEDEEA